MYKKLPLFAAVLLFGAAGAIGCSQNTSPARVQYQESGMIDESGAVSYAPATGEYPRCFYDESKCKWMLDRGPDHPWYLKRYDDDCNADCNRMSFSASSSSNSNSCGLCNLFKPSQTCPTVKETGPAPAPLRFKPIICPVKETCPAPVQYRAATCPVHKEKCPAYRGSACPFMENNLQYRNAPVTTQPGNTGWNSGY